MSALFDIVAPVFLLIGLGYLSLKAGYLSTAAIDVLPRFATAVAVPCLLFRAVAALDLGAALNWRLLLSFYLPALLSFSISAWVARGFFARRPGESVSAGFAALFGNTLFIGLPVIERAYGEAGVAVAFGIISVHAMSTYLLGSVVMESVSAMGRGPVYALKETFKALARNPLVVSVALGFVANLLSWSTPRLIDQSLSLLAQSALPVGMFCIGAALTQYRLSEQWTESLAVSVIKLLLFPSLAFALAMSFHHYAGLSPIAVKVVVVLAALPSGINVYLFATLYQRAQALAASVLLLSTALSVLSLSAWLLLLAYCLP